MSIAGVVLAAGASTRLGAPKQLVTDGVGETLVHRAARQLLEAGCAPVFVIVGAERSGVVDALADLAVRVVDNDQWPEGIASSIRCAVAAARREPTPTAIDALLLSTCDMPTVGTTHLRALCAAYLDGAVRVASRYATPDGTETVGIPAIVGTIEWPWLDALHGDRGAKPLFLQPETQTVPLAGGSFDIDRPLDVQAWRDV